MLGKNPAFQFYPGDWFREPGLRAASISAKGAWAQILFSMHDAPERGKLSGALSFWANLIGGVQPWGQWEQHGSYCTVPWTIDSDTSENTALHLLRELVDNQVCDVEFEDNISRCIFEGIDPPNMNGNLQSVTDRNVKITIINRRMYRDYLEGERNKKKQQNYRDRHKPQQDSTQNNHIVTKQRNHNVTAYSSSSSSSSVAKDINTFTSDSPEYRLSELLLNLIKERDPKAKADLQKWAIHIDLLIRKDDRSPEDIENVIRWCQDDDFWRSNILSTKKLREKFTALVQKMGPPKYNPIEALEKKRHDNG